MKTAIMVFLAMLASEAFAEEDALARFNKAVEAALKDREGDKSEYFDRHYRPIVEGLTSPDAAVRQRARDLMRPLLRDGWIAVDQFYSIGWDNLDVIARGMYLWCVAGGRTWGDNEALGGGGFLLKPEIAVKIWASAAREPVALPFLKEAAVRWSTRRSAGSPPIRLGDHLAPADRAKLMLQYLSILSDCRNVVERSAVAWMIVDLIGPDSSTLADWYASQADPAMRRLLPESLSEILRPASEDHERKQVLANSKDALKKRLPVLRALSMLASKDWEEKAAAKGREVQALLETVQ